MIDQQKDGTVRPEERQENKKNEKKRAATQSSKKQAIISLSSWRGKDDTRDPREGRDRGANIITIIKKIKTNVTKKTNSNIG